MKRTLLSILTFSIFTFVAVAQTTDYSKVIFSSKIYEYKNDEPRTQELGIDKDLLSSIINNLGDSLYSEKNQAFSVLNSILGLENSSVIST
mgnify:FL=1